MLPNPLEWTKETFSLLLGVRAYYNVYNPSNRVIFGHYGAISLGETNHVVVLEKGQLANSAFDDLSGRPQIHTIKAKELSTWLPIVKAHGLKRKPRKIEYKSESPLKKVG